MDSGCRQMREMVERHNQHIAITPKIDLIDISLGQIYMQESVTLILLSATRELSNSET